MNKKIIVSLMIFAGLSVEAAQHSFMYYLGYGATKTAQGAVWTAGKLSKATKMIYSNTTHITFPATIAAGCWTTLLAAQTSNNWNINFLQDLCITEGKGMLVASVGMFMGLVTLFNTWEAVMKKIKRTFGLEAKHLGALALSIVALHKMYSTNHVPNPVEVVSYLLSK
jgi:hypothetical protein